MTVEEAIRLNPAGIPVELRALPRWVCWQFEKTRKGKRTKVPRDAKAPERPASTTDPATWAPFEQALAVKEAAAFDGVGFVFGPPYFGVDLDGCRDPATGAVEPKAAAAVARIDTYTEVSVSGRGVHLIGRGALPSGDPLSDRRRKGHVEMYDAGRYFTMTGIPLNGQARPIADRQAEIAAWHAEVFGPAADRKAAAPPPAVAPPAAPPAAKVGRLVLRADANPPAEKLTAALANDPRLFKRTWERRRTDLQDQSASAYDMSLASLAASMGWSDQEIADAIIAWRRTHGEAGDGKALRIDYMTRTITKARTSRREGDEARAAAAALADAAREPDGAVDDAQRAALLANASKVLGVAISAFEQLGRDPATATFALVLAGDRRVPLGSAADVLLQRRVQAALYATTGRAIPGMKPVAWTNLCSALGRVRRLVENADSVRANETVEWMKQYFYRVRVHDAGADAIPSNAPFRSDGYLYVHAPSLMRFVKMDLCQMQVDRGDLWARLHELGFTPTAVSAQTAGQPVTRRYWAGPDRWKDEDSKRSGGASAGLFTPPLV